MNTFNGIVLFTGFYFVSFLTLFVLGWILHRLGLRAVRAWTLKRLQSKRRQREAVIRMVVPQEESNPFSENRIDGINRGLAALRQSVSERESRAETRPPTPKVEEDPTFWERLRKDDL